MLGAAFSTRKNQRPNSFEGDVQSRLLYDMSTSSLLTDGDRFSTGRRRHEILTDWRMSAARLPWIDHLRTLVIVLVVNLHSCITYSHVGSWYAMSEHEPSMAVKLPFIVWEATLQSFFMGLLFFISGYFAHGSLVRKGPVGFVRERLFRLGLPTLFFMFVVHPFILLGLNPWHTNFGPPVAYYLKFIRTGRWLHASGPLWFALALLVFSIVLAGVVRFGGGPPEARRERKGKQGSTVLLCFVIAVSLGTFLVRLFQPIGSTIFNMQLGYFVQYIAFFSAGVSAAKQGWLLDLSGSRTAARAGWCALVGGPLVLLGILMLGNSSGVKVFAGGWHWQAFALAVWEQLTGTGLSLGLLALFSARVNRDGPGLRWLADRSFAVYVLHTPVLVGLMMLLRSFPQNPYILAGLLTTVGLVVSFLLADLARRLPGLRAIL
jgi:glucan biosynthesis protein C